MKSTKHIYVCQKIQIQSVHLGHSTHFPRAPSIKNVNFAHKISQNLAMQFAEHIHAPKGRPFYPLSHVKINK